MNVPFPPLEAHHASALKARHQQSFSQPAAVGFPDLAGGESPIVELQLVDGAGEGVVVRRSREPSVIADTDRGIGRRVERAEGSHCGEVLRRELAVDENAHCPGGVVERGCDVHKPTDGNGRLHSRNLVERLHVEPQLPVGQDSEEVRISGIPVVATEEDHPEVGPRWRSAIKENPARNSEGTGQPQAGRIR